MIPLKLRKKFGIKRCTKIFFYEEDDGIKLVPVTPQLIKANKGFLGKDTLISFL